MSDWSDETKVVEEKSGEDQAKGGEKGKSCKGYLYYTSTLKSEARNPRCVGLPRALQPVPRNIVAHSEAENSREGRALRDFYYGCLGYSVYLTEKDSSAIKQGKRTQLPVCVGLEVFVDKKVASAGQTSSAPAHVHREDAREVPQPRPNRPTAPAGEDFFNRFARSANLVASGVARNMRRIGNHIKEGIDDLLYPDRRRPK